MSLHLVTGGAGFIGSNIVKELLKRGETVRVFDNFATGRRSNLVSVQDQIELIEGDLRNYHNVLDAVEGVDYIYHQAALPSVPRSIKDPITSTEVGANGTVHVLEAARRFHVKRVMFASSSSVYGDAPEREKVETLKTNPKSPYAIGKLAAENFCQVYFKLYGLETVAIRYFNVFGGNQDPNSQYAAVIPKFIRLMASGQRPTIYGDGSTARDFTYVGNVVRANLAASVAPNAAGEVINVACGESFTLNDMVGGINKVLGTGIVPFYEDFRPGDIHFSLADIGKAKTLLGYEPKITFFDGLALAIEEMKRNGEI